MKNALLRTVGVLIGLAGIGLLIGFLMGQLMKKSRGKADPKLANALLTRTINQD